MRAFAAGGLRRFLLRLPGRTTDFRPRLQASQDGARSLVESLERRTLLSTYYVSASGHDSALGTSVSAAWHSISRVNVQVLKAGDHVLFQGGKTFNGSLYLSSKESGTASKQIVFSTYGSGKATISSGSSRGFDIAETGGIAISNLKFLGNGMYKNSSVGIDVHVDWAGKKVSSIDITNVEVTGYGREGIYFLADGKGSAINDVKVEYTDSHDNLYAGLKAHNDKISGMQNYLIDHVRVWNNFGSKSASDVTGSGIMLEGVANAVISRSIAHDNGKDGAAPVGIWAAMGNNVTIQYCESYNNRTRAATDGGGFDLDWDVTNSVMQYNYSHGNDGPGYLLAAAAHKSDNNVIRYNVSENDGRKNGTSGIQIWGNVTNALINNNTVFLSATGNDQSAAFIAHDEGAGGKEPWNVLVRDNIFYTTGGAKLVRATTGVVSKGAVKLTGNDYFANGQKFTIQWGNSSFGDITAWQKKTGQETVRHKATGYEGNPRLYDPGKGGTIGNADKLDSLAAYRITDKSKLINRGLAIPTFLDATITQDFFGDRLHDRIDIGADEVR